MKIVILDKLEEFAYLIRSILRAESAFQNIEITTKELNSKYDLLISDKNSTKNLKDLNKDNTLLIGVDILRPLRGTSVLSVVKSWAVKHDLYTMPTYIKKERKEESYAEALEKSKEMTKAREAKKLKKFRKPQSKQGD